MTNPITSVNDYRRELLLQRLGNAVENYLEERTCGEIQQELYQMYMDNMRSPDYYIEDLYDFVNEHGDAE